MLALRTDIRYLFIMRVNNGTSFCLVEIDRLTFVSLILICWFVFQYFCHNVFVFLKVFILFLSWSFCVNFIKASQRWDLVIYKNTMLSKVSCRWRRKHNWLVLFSPLWRGAWVITFLNYTLFYVKSCHTGPIFLNFEIVLTWF